MYREYPSRIADVVCTWERVQAQAGQAHVVPDGCVDIVAYADGRLVVAGPDTQPWHSPMEPDLQVTGVRLAAGTARQVLGLPVSEVRDARVPVSALNSWADAAQVADAVESALTDRRAVLTNLVVRHLGDPDRLVRAAVGRLEQEPRLRMANLADELGVSVRHLHRRFVEHVGYGPKTYARVARMQRFLAVAPDSVSIANAAYVVGYASQAHLNDEFRALTNTTPVRFLEERSRPAA